MCMYGCACARARTYVFDFINYFITKIDLQSFLQTSFKKFRFL